MDNEQKTFRDFFGKDIKIGHHVLHLWADVTNNKVIGGTSAIKHKRAKVVGFSAQGVRIEWEKNRQIKRSTIFNTRNRLMILAHDGTDTVDGDMRDNNLKQEFLIYKEKMAIRLKDIQKEKKAQDIRIIKLLNYIKELEKTTTELEAIKDAFEEMKKKMYRFEVMDI